MMQKQGIRMLAAVMFSDMVGYTAMMQEDEDRAKKLRDRYRRVLEEKVLLHKGRVIQYFGDGSLTIFGSVIEAVCSAEEIQIELQNEPQVKLRIGIHAGEVVYDDDGVYGDSVNIAARIENLGMDGSVLFSNKVNDELRNHKEFNTTSLGLFELKNVKYPIEVFALKNSTLSVPSRREMSGKIGGGESIAVLPFVNMSPESDNEYFSDGITEEILNALSKVDGLKVTSRTSSFAFKGTNTDIREIGKQLAVKTVLEGSVRKVGNKVRVTAQLIDTKDGYHKWSDVYDRDIQDIFRVQDEIATSISEKLKQSLKVPASKSKPLVKTTTNNLEAYNLFLKAGYFWNKWTPADVRRALELLEKAIQMDPNYAQAYSALSACYVYLGALGQMPSKIAYPKSKEYALIALKMDDCMPDSHLALAMVNFFNWQWDESYKSFLKALELNPSNAEAHHYFSYYMMAIGNIKKALFEAEKAHELDPLSVVINSSLADMYMNANMLESAVEQYNRTLEIEPTFRAALNGLGWTYYLLGDNDKALQTFKKSQMLAGDDFKATATLGYLYAKMGKRDEVAECLKKLDIRSEREKDVNFNMDYAIIYIGLGDLEKVFEHLVKAFEEKLGGLMFLRGRAFREIQNDPRYFELIKKMNLPID